MHTLKVLLQKGYPPHDTRVNKGKAQIGHQGHRTIEALKGDKGIRFKLPHHHRQSNLYGW